jgi:branched-chain amino acid transport system ATP-binding protein
MSFAGAGVALHHDLPAGRRYAAEALPEGKVLVIPKKFLAMTELIGQLQIPSLTDEQDRLPGELPYPVQKRVALARALVSDPKLLLLDEPAGGVSAADMSELGRLIRSWVPERTVLLVEHHMELVMEVCDLIWVLDAGKVIASGTPDEVRNDPAVLAAYLGQEGAA